MTDSSVQSLTDVKASPTSLAEATPCPCCQFLPDGLFLPPSVFTTPTVVQRLGSDCEAGDSVVHPRYALERIRQANCGPLVDTHSHAHLERESTITDHDLYNTDGDDVASSMAVVSLTCAVDPSDWNACLRHTAQSPHRLSALGIHPWYLDCITLPTLDGDARTADKTFVVSDEGTIEGETHTKPLYGWLSELEYNLQQHPRCLVGEIGLCKMAKFLRTYPLGKSAALQLQRQVFQQQLMLAAKYQRPASIHCVQQHGVLLDLFKELWSNNPTRLMNGNRQATNRAPKLPPPAMALHSYTGTAHHIRQLLQWEEQVLRFLKVPTAQPILYFGFSHMVNVTMCTSEKSKRQGREAVLAVPRDRLLAESDVHCTKHEARGTAGAVAYLAWALDEPIELLAKIVATNGLRFLNALPTMGVPVDKST